MLYAAAPTLSPAAASAATPSEQAACLYSTGDQREGADQICIRAKSFEQDLCGAIENFARENEIPPSFFARLIWQESGFRAHAVSPKGAQGIAQFMPGTALLRGVSDSFDVLQALEASARYLAELRQRFGNLGLAAAAYNAGEARTQDFLTTNHLPLETRGYVLSITGHSAEDWKASNVSFPAAPLDPSLDFVPACLALAKTRHLKAPPYIAEGVWQPWGVQLVASGSANVTRTLFARAVARLPAPFRDEKPLILRRRDRSFGFRPRYAGRLGRATREAANETCARIMRAGEACLVFKN